MTTLKSRRSGKDLRNHPSLVGAQAVTDIVELLRSVEAPKYLMWEAADVIERQNAVIEMLRAYATHERSLGAEGPTIELVNARQEIERLRAALHAALEPKP